MKIVFLIIFIFPISLFAQTTKKDSIWLPLKVFIGQWAGEGGGESGKGKYQRSYNYTLNNNFIEIRNKSEYEPTKKYPKGEVHEDIGFFSYDKSLKKFKLRQFHIESFVNEYVLDSVTADNKTLVFTSIAIENIPKGYKARETYKILNDKEIEETFEIAEPNKDFEVYSKVKLKRQK